MALLKVKTELSKKIDWGGGRSTKLNRTEDICKTMYDMSIPITIYQNTKDELDKSKNIKKKWPKCRNKYISVHISA